MEPRFFGLWGTGKYGKIKTYFIHLGQEKDQLGKFCCVSDAKNLKWNRDLLSDAISDI